MLENAGVVSRWKITPHAEDPAELALYSQGVCRRIFLASIFSYAPALLAVLFTIALSSALKIGVQLTSGKSLSRSYLPKPISASSRACSTAR